MNSEELLEKWRASWVRGEGEECVRFLQFLYEPARYVHGSRMRKVFCDLECVRTLAATRRGWVRINGLLLHHFSLAGPSEGEPNLLPRQRIIYESCNRLQRVANLAGAIICSSEIQLVVQRGEHCKILEAIGDEAYGFAIRRTVFFADAIARLSHMELHGHTPSKRAAEAGRWCVSACLDGLAADVKKRFALKFPAGRGWQSAAKAPAGPVEDAWSLVSALLARVDGGAS
ncbi:MAG: SctK family type III secretion system sorting platform protein [Puniceicoccales bacterium]|jgi:hypothetical protein|nr:SctK family type III secretion system sorting platform protein [Puniceicoccales bacterium]